MPAETLRGVSQLQAAPRHELRQRLALQLTALQDRLLQLRGRQRQGLSQREPRRPGCIRCSVRNEPAEAFQRHSSDHYPRQLPEGCEHGQDRRVRCRRRRLR